LRWWKTHDPVGTLKHCDKCQKAPAKEGKHHPTGEKIQALRESDDRQIESQQREAKGNRCLHHDCRDDDYSSSHGAGVSFPQWVFGSQW